MGGGKASVRWCHVSGVMSVIILYCLSVPVTDGPKIMMIKHNVAQGGMPSNSEILHYLIIIIQVKIDQFHPDYNKNINNSIHFKLI